VGCSSGGAAQPGPGQFAYASWALLGAWLRFTVSFIVIAIAWDRRPSDQAGFTAIALVLVGLVVGARVARSRLSE